jgi:lambda repressor-like predicted transcriptional regulator
MKDWTPSRVVGEIKIKGSTLRQLSRNGGIAR